MTRFCITDESRQVKMAIIDKHVTPLMSVNDPELMLAKPAGLTAATGMDALTHAIEAYVSTAATPVTDASAVMAIALIAEHLRTAVHQGRISMPASRWPMPSSGRHGLQQRKPGLCARHGSPARRLLRPAPRVCNAVLLPHVQAYNARVRRPAQGCGPSYGGGCERHER
jgi:alcohol dehydrogenase